MAIILLEDALVIIRWNARTLITHAETDVCVLDPHAYRIAPHSSPAGSLVRPPSRARSECYHPSSFPWHDTYLGTRTSLSSRYLLTIVRVLYTSAVRHY